MDVINVHVGRRGFYSFNGIDRALTGQGYSVLRTRVHPTCSVQRRAMQLKEQVLKNLAGFPAGTRAIIVAHSMGGLDARHMISNLGMHDKVLALLTISTPHFGTTYADYMLRNLKRVHAIRLLKAIGLDMAGVADLTPEECQKFNDKTPDMPCVRYFSISAACQESQVPPWGRRSFRILLETEGPNDGLVSVRSSIYAEHLGTWPVDHWTLLNKSFGRPADANVIHLYLDALERVSH